MIKLVIFDLSGICTTDEEPPFLKKFAEENNIDFDELCEVYVPLLEKAERDQMSAKEVWDEVMKKFNFKMDVDKYIAGMIATKELWKDALEFINSLRKKYKTAYYTNYCRDYWKAISEKFDISPYFDFGFPSYQAKARKTDKKGFEMLMEHFDVKPEETVFIDDSARNLKAAEELGIKTIHLTDRDKLKEELEKAGVEV